MSRTRRKIRRWKRGEPGREVVEGGDAQLGYAKGGTTHKRKMKPYERKEGNLKFRPIEDGKKITKEAKLVVKNANRSRKKAYRQQLKKELKDELRQHTGHT